MRNETLSAYTFLTTPEGQAILEGEAFLGGTILERITRLRRRVPRDVATAVVNVIEVRRRAARKFRLASRMLFDPEGYEQASAEDVARYRSGLFAGSSEVLDGGTGIGMDAIALADIAAVTSIEQVEARRAMARWNARVYGVEEKVRWEPGDLLERLGDFDHAFVDPSRRARGRRAPDPDLASPPLGEIIPRTGAGMRLAVKASPMISVHRLPGDPAVEVISLGGEVKEVTLLFGPWEKPRRAATVLPGPHTLPIDPADAGSIPIVPPGRFILHPDPAIRKAEGVDALGRMVGHGLLSARGPILTGDDPARTPFGSTFEVVEILPAGENLIRRWLASHPLARAEIRGKHRTLELRRIQTWVRRGGSEDRTIFLAPVGERDSMIVGREVT